MLLDLNLRNKSVVVFGGGSVATRKVAKLIKAKARVVVVSSSFSSRLFALRRGRKLSLRRSLIERRTATVNRLISKADLVVAATSDARINRVLASRARKAGTPVSVVDNPTLSDFSFPATAEVGPIRVALYTDGRSPGMAGLLRRRIEQLITKEDILQVKLQSYARQLAKKALLNHKTRKTVLLRMTTDTRIRKLLSQSKFGEAKKRVQRIITMNENRSTRLN